MGRRTELRRRAAYAKLAGEIGLAPAFHEPTEATPDDTPPRPPRRRPDRPRPGTVGAEIDEATREKLTRIANDMD